MCIYSEDAMMNAFLILLLQRVEAAGRQLQYDMLFFNFLIKI